MNKTIPSNGYIICNSFDQLVETLESTSNNSKSITLSTSLPNNSTNQKNQFQSSLSFNTSPIQPEITSSPQMNKKKKHFNEESYNIPNLKVFKNHKQLDEFIQNSLDKFKLVPPMPSLYEATGNDQDYIISHKSTIPDLVIWNKTFNKNECFIDAYLDNENNFPRFQFYLRIKSTKHLDQGRKNEDNYENENNNESEFKDTNNINYNMQRNIEEQKEKINKKLKNLKEGYGDENILDKLFESSDEEEEKIKYSSKINSKNTKKISSHKLNDNNNINKKNLNIQQKNNDINIKLNSYNNKSGNNIKPKYPQCNNIFNNMNNNTIYNNNKYYVINNNLNKYPIQNSSMNYQSVSYNNSCRSNSNLNYNKNCIINNNINNIQYQNFQLEFLIKIVYKYLEKEGWIILSNQIRMFRKFKSLDLYKFLIELSKSINLASITITDEDSLITQSGDKMLNILSKIIPIVITIINNNKINNIINYQFKSEQKNQTNLNINTVNTGENQINKNNKINNNGEYNIIDNLFNYKNNDNKSYNFNFSLNSNKNKEDKNDEDSVDKLDDFEKIKNNLNFSNNSSSNDSADKVIHNLDLNFLHQDIDNFLDNDEQ